MFIGVDIGSVSVDAVLMNGGREIVEEHYVRTKGRPIESCMGVL